MGSWPGELVRELLLVGGMSQREGILVVDDDRTACDVIAAALEQAGYGVVTATDGFDALGKLATYQPDLVLTDLQMPGIDGLELIQRMQASDRPVPAILMTGAETQDLCTGAEAYGAVNCLRKPINLDDLVWTIECALVCRERLRGMRARPTHVARFA